MNFSQKFYFRKSKKVKNVIKKRVPMFAENRTVDFINKKIKEFNFKNRNK